MRGVQGAMRVLAWTAAALIFTALSALAFVAGFTILTSAFMTHDARGMPVEPEWAGYVALYGGVALAGALVGYVFGRSTGLRATDGLLTGILGSVCLWGLWCLTLVWRGHRLDAAELLGGWPLLITATPVMALCAEWGSRVRASLG
jgi:hypothetical protein